MKTKLRPVLLALALCAGCSTVDPTTGQRVPPDPAKTVAAIRAVVPPAVALAVAEEPRTRVYFAAAVVVIQTLEAKGPVSPQALQDALAGIGVKELRTDEARVAVAAALGIYSAFWGDAVSAKLDAAAFAGPVLSALREALIIGIQ